MPVITAPNGPTHEVGPTRFTSLATPSTGSVETSVWEVSIPPDTPSTPHSLTREEVFVVLAGRATVSIDGFVESAQTGDAIVVPAGRVFALSNEGSEPLRLLCCLPVGGQACLPDGNRFTPPWAL